MVTPSTSLQCPPSPHLLGQECGRSINQLLDILVSILRQLQILLLSQLEKVTGWNGRSVDDSLFLPLDSINEIWRENGQIGPICVERLLPGGVDGAACIEMD